MTQPMIVVGYGAIDPELAFTSKGGPLEKFVHRNLHRDLSTVMIVPTRGSVPARVVDSWLSMLKAPNQRFAQLMAVGMEVGAAYDALVHMILSNAELSNWRYILTVEEDNLPPPMAFVDLLEAAEEYDMDVLGGLYYVKGSSGFPQIWGDPDDEVENYRPQVPYVDGVGDQNIVRCNGTGMGFTLYKVDLFRRLEAPWFRTECAEDNLWTQDLYFFHKMRQNGVTRPDGSPLRIGVHCGVRIGHMDTSGNLW